MSGYVPGFVSGCTENDISEGADRFGAGVTELGVNVAVMPAGNAVAHESDTALLNPLIDWTLMVVAVVPPAGTVTVTGFALSAKSGTRQLGKRKLPTRVTHPEVEVTA